MKSNRERDRNAARAGDGSGRADLEPEGRDARENPAQAGAGAAAAEESGHLGGRRQDVPEAAGGDEERAPQDVAPGNEAQALREERDALRDRLLRLAAEFDNYRKRTAREWQENQKRAAAEVLRDMLELADNLERALAAPEDGTSLRRGVELILQQLQSKLKRFGVEAMEVEGQEFDPIRHEAVLLVDAVDVASQHVVDVVQRGYLLHGEVLRPARVTVSR